MNCANCLLGDGFFMCLTPIYLPSGHYVDESTGMTMTKYRKVPCGKCIECLQKKQMEQAVLAIEESKKYKTMHFFTLTYRPEDVPISHIREYVDLETGEYEGYVMKDFNRKYGYDKRTVNFIDKVEDTNIRKEIYANQRKNKHNFVKEAPVPFNPSRLAVDTYTFSLRREDVKNWIKRCRRKWEYNHPNEPLKFSYYGAGEYGSQTWRPHYHFQFFGLSDDQAAFFSNEWKLGYVDCQAVSKLSSDDMVKVSMYTAKYITKIPLAFEDNEEHLNAINDKVIEKPRKQGSVNYGISGDFEKIKAEILKGADVDVYDSQAAKEIIQNKTSYHYNGNDYPIPTKIKDRVFKKFDGEGLHITPLRKAIMDIMEDRELAVHLRELRQVMCSPEYKGISYPEAAQILIEKEKEDRRNKYKIKKDNILKKYMKSKIK